MDGKSQSELPDKRCYSEKNMTLRKELSAQKKTYRLSDAEAGTKSLTSLSLLATLCTDDDLAQDLL